MVIIQPNGWTFHGVFHRVVSSLALVGSMALKNLELSLKTGSKNKVKDKSKEQNLLK
jgi:hypothetical protein